MGLDLHMLPFDAQNGFNFSHTVLSLERRGELWPIIQKIEQSKGYDVPERFSSFLGLQENGEHGYGDTRETPYGETLKYVCVKYLWPLKGKTAVQDNYKNRAIWAYLECLPPDTWIALYWH